MLVALAACTPRQPGEQSSSAPAVMQSATKTQSPTPARTPAVAVPVADPHSDQAAAALVETYYELLGQKDFAAANRLWGSAAKDPAAFKAQFADLAEIHAEVGAPPPSEGAAGSIYIEVPVEVRTRQVGGVARREKGNVVLRRVNNVDGATPGQLEWHIMSIDLSST